MMHTIFLLVLCFVNTINAVIDWDSFDSNVYLDEVEKVQLFWTILNATHIEFGIKCITLGWCAIGISEDIYMTDTDIIFFWIDDDDGNVYLQDRYASSRSIPTLDNLQNLTLIEGMQINDTSMVHFIRPLYPCNDQDIEIQTGTTRILHAYNHNDPDYLEFDETVEWHGYHNVGSKSVNLLTISTFSTTNTINDSNYDYFDILMPNVTLPAENDTTYYCSLIKLPELDDVHHIVQLDPVITEGNEGIVHHIIMYFCPSDKVSDSDVGFTELCTKYANMPTEIMPSSDCTFGSIVYGWAIGGGSFAFPAHAGMEISGPAMPDHSELQYVLMEMHYDNPLHLANVTDSSGIRAWYTDKLRNETASVLDVGLVVSEAQFIPKGMESAVNYAYCSSDCTAAGLPEDGIHIFGSILHAHTVGVSIVLRHIAANGTELAPIDINLNYDFNYQQGNALAEEVLLMPGDRMLVECEYDTTSRDGTVFGGLATKDEMCLAFIFVYPKPDLASCFSTHDENDLEVFAAVSYVYEYMTNFDEFDYNISKPGAKEWYDEYWHGEGFDKRWQICWDSNRSSLIDDWSLSVKEFDNFTEYDYSSKCDNGESDTILTTEATSAITTTQNFALQKGETIYFVNFIIGCFAFYGMF